MNRISKDDVWSLNLNSDITLDKEKEIELDYWKKFIISDHTNKAAEVMYGADQNASFFTLFECWGSVIIGQFLLMKVRWISYLIKYR